MNDSLWNCKTEQEMQKALSSVGWLVSQQCWLFSMESSHLQHSVELQFVLTQCNSWLLGKDSLFLGGISVQNKWGQVDSNKGKAQQA